MKTTTPPPQNCPNNGMRKFSLIRLNTAKLFPSPVTSYFRSRKQHNNTEQSRGTQRQSKDWSRALGQKLCLPSKCTEKASHKCATLTTLRSLLLRSVEEKWSKQMFLKTPVLESKLITLRTEHHQAQNSGITAWDKMPDPHTKHLSKIISPTQQRIQQNRSYITGAKQCHAQQWNSLGQRVSTSILPHHLSAYLNFTGGQLPTPQSATFSLGCKKSGSDRKEREDGKMSLCCLLPCFHPLQCCCSSRWNLTKQADSYDL